MADLFDFIDGNRGVGNFRFGEFRPQNSDGSSTLSGGRIIGAEEIRDFHLQSDVDESTLSQHHTLGYGPGQAMPGSNPGWTALPLSTNIVNFNTATYNNPQFRKIGDTVKVRGLVKTTAAFAGGSIIATLPVGNLPIRTYLFPTALGGNIFGIIQVMPNGTFVVTQALNNGDYIGLDMIKIHTS